MDFKSTSSKKGKNLLRKNAKLRLYISSAGRTISFTGNFPVSHGDYVDLLSAGGKSLFEVMRHLL